jgi:hypothetical protein
VVGQPLAAETPKASCVTTHDYDRMSQEKLNRLLLAPIQ